MLDVIVDAAVKIICCRILLAVSIYWSNLGTFDVNVHYSCVQVIK